MFKKTALFLRLGFPKLEVYLNEDERQIYLADIPSVPGSSVIRHHVSFGDFVLHFRVLFKTMVKC